MARFRGVDPPTIAELPGLFGPESLLLLYVWITDSTNWKLVEKLVHNVIFYITT